MAIKRIKAVIQFRRAEAKKWLKVDPVLREGEPGFEIDTGYLKIGDGKTPWSQLEYMSGESNLPVIIENPVDKQILLYDADLGCWRNYQLSDESSIIYSNSGLSLKGYEEAAQGQMLVKDENEGIAWVDPLSDQQLQEAVEVAEGAAARANTSALQAGNFAGDAARSAAQVEGKFWYGTIEEYNALEHISRSTIYIILNE